MDSIPMGFKHLCKAQPKYKLENPGSTTKYAWDLNKPVNLSPQLWQNVKAVALQTHKARDKQGTMLTFCFKCITVNVKWVGNHTLF